MDSEQEPGSVPRSVKGNWGPVEDADRLDEGQTMKVCPKCGYIDNSMWRQNRWRTNVEFIKIEYVTDIPKHVLRAYNEGDLEIITDSFYAYRLCRKQNIIERILKAEYDAFGKSGFHQPRG